MSVFSSRAPWSAVDGPQLAVAAAALQLLPSNVPCLLRLERLAAIGASLPPNQASPSITPNSLRRILKMELIDDAHIRAQEDEYDDVYAVEIPFHGGPKLALQGLCSRSGEIIEIMISGIFRSPNELPEEYKEEAYALTHLILAISNNMCRLAGLDRSAPAKNSKKRHVDVPSARTLSELLAAVFIDDDTLKTLVPAEVGDHFDAALASCSVLPGMHECKFQNGSDDSLVLTPLARVSGGFNIINPAELISCLRHKLIVMAIDHRCEAELARAYLAELAARMILKLGRIAVPVGNPILSTETGILRQMFDGDGISIDLAVLSDDFRNFDKIDPFGSVPHNPAGEIQSVLDNPDDPNPSTNRTLRIGIIDTMSRGAFLGLEDLRTPGPLAIFKPDELVTIIDLDGEDPLCIWYFAVAEESASERSRIMSYSSLDTYSIYRENENSFYLSDEEKPTLITIAPSSGAHLRVSAKQKLDRHLILDPDGETFVGVIARYPNGTPPMYLPTRIGLNYSVVEAEDVTVWVSDEMPKSYSDVFRDVTCYWLAQICQVCPYVYSPHSNAKRQVFVNVKLLAPEGWENTIIADTEALTINNSDSWVTVGAQESIIVIEFNGALSGVVRAAENIAERQLVTALVQFLLPEASVEQAMNIVNEVVDSEEKRIIRVLPPTEVDLRDSGVSCRTVMAAAIAPVLDRLGDHFISGGWHLGQAVPSSERNAVLGKAVDFYYGCIVSLVSELECAGLIDYLMAMDESLLHEMARERYKLPGEIACFGSKSDHVKELIEASSAHTAAAMASRFLIEYVAAVPPSGTTEIDLLVYDELMALSSELIARATLSDAILYKFSDVELNILESGRLGVSRGDRYTAGFSNLMKIQAEARLAMALGNLPRAVRSPSTEVDDSKKANEIDAAMRDEFGFTLSELGAGLYELVNYADELGYELCRVRREEVLKHLCKKMSWSPSTAEAFIAAITLMPRSNFLSVKNDAYPWKLNREWSYVRRPLIEEHHSDGAKYLVWCVRRTFSAASFWLDLVFSGRIKCHNKGKLNTLMGSIRQDANKQFEEDVAAVLRANGVSQVVRGIKKFNGKRIADRQGNDLGDVDAMGICLKRKLVIAAEAKDFELARNPVELSNEVANLLEGEKSAIAKHGRRIIWIQNNIHSVLRQFGVEGSAAGWRVVPVVVTSRNLIGPHIVKKEMPVITLAILPDWLGQLIGGHNPRRRNSRNRIMKN